MQPLPAPDPVIIKSETVKAVEEASIKPRRDHRGPYTTQEGIILKYRKVSQQLIYKVWSNLEIPKVPMVWIEDRGRDEPNPVDPTYLESLGRYHHDKLHASMLTFFMRGVDIFRLPESFIPVESNEWFEGLDIDIPKSADGRKAAYLLYYAIPDDTEQSEILQDLMILSGMVMERDIDEALDSFRGNQGAEVDSATPSTS